MPGKTTWIEGIQCIECPICRTIESPPYSHLVHLLFESRGQCRQIETEYRRKLNELREQTEDFIAVIHADRLEAQEMRKNMEQQYKSNLEASQSEVEKLKHRLKLKIRLETQEPARSSKTQEFCSSCSKKTQRTCNVYGCRKHCCMKCVICSDCEECVAKL
jgi:hypothetical protein